MRGPAAFCGIVGLKPSHAMIPVYPPSPMGDLEHIGLFARSVADLRPALDALGGRDRNDPASWPFRTPLDRPVADPQSLNFAASVDLNYGDPAAALRDRFAEVVSKLRHAGFRIDDIEVPISPDFETCYELFVPDAAATLALAPPQRHELVDPEIRALAGRSDQMTVREYAAVEAVRDDTRRSFARLFEQVDCLLTLTQETLPNRLDETPGIMKLTRCFNVTGQPAISIPCGASRSGLSIGLQLVCDVGADSLLLGITEAVAGVLDEI